jgi:hypothetical protein
LGASDSELNGNHVRNDREESVVFVIPKNSAMQLDWHGDIGIIAEQS